jgi:hypothetical protein
VTALVGILNKRAAVIAADSAVTVTKGDNKKIINTANKVFRLTKHSPIGVMICGSSEFMGIPWEVLIKLYRDKNPDVKFDTLKEYVESFIEFLRHERHCSDKNYQLESLQNELSDYYFKIQEFTQNDYDEALKNCETDEADIDKLKMKFLDENFQLLDTRSEENGLCQDFEKYPLKRLQSYGKEVFDKLENSCRDDKMPGTRKEWEKHFLKYVKSKLFIGKDSTIVFVGYGENDIYPSLIPVVFAGCFDGRIRYYIDKEQEEYISNDNAASICPFAQSDTMISLLKGVHPKMYDTIFEKLCNSLDAVKKKMIDAVEASGVDKTVAEAMDSIDLKEISDGFHSEILEQINDAFIDGTVDAVDSFHIDDMVKMAESLISITNLQRHFSSSEESVGGPVDVAVITKSEGFVWVNHKQWFQQQMNPQMME